MLQTLETVAADHGTTIAIIAAIVVAIRQIRNYGLRQERRTKSEA